MPTNPKLYIPEAVHLLTFRTEEGLPFVAAEHIKVILEGIIARACERYDVTLCHYIWMGNHAHFIIVVNDPEAVSDFIGYLKTESAHAINRILGRQRKTVWCDGSDCPVLLTPESVIDKIAYVYANPALANLVETIEDYPMLSSWEMFSRKRYIKHCPVVSRDQVPFLGARHLSLRHQEGFANSLRSNAKTTAKLRLSPNAWIKCFKELDRNSHEEINQQILDRVRCIETEAMNERIGPVIGALILRTQDMDVLHVPKKHSPKMICISSDKEFRIRFVQWAKELFHRAKLAYAAWKRGELYIHYPPGLFAPRLPRLANMLSPL